MTVYEEPLKHFFPWTSSCTPLCIHCTWDYCRHLTRAYCKPALSVSKMLGPAPWQKAKCDISDNARHLQHTLLPFMMRNSSLCGSETTACLECPKGDSKTTTKSSSLSHYSPFSADQVNTARGKSTSGKRQVRHCEDVLPHLPKAGLYFLHTYPRDNYQQWCQWMNLVLLAASDS